MRFLFYEWRGSPIWGWLIIAFVVAITALSIVGAFVGWDVPSRCDSHGDCWPEY